MAQPPKTTILDHFADLDDPRVERTRHHNPVDIIASAICATICGADSWVHVELFGKSKLAWFQSFLELPYGIPSRDTFGNVCARLGPAQLQNCFVAWPQAIAELLPGEVVVIDGKTARRSYDRAGKKGTIHRVSAWATQQSRGPKPLEHRKLAALDFGRDLSGRPAPRAQGSRLAEHSHAAADWVQPAEKRKNPEGGHPGQAAQRRVGQGLPAQSPPPVRRDCPACPCARLTATAPAV